MTKVLVKITNTLEKTLVILNILSNHSLQKGVQINYSHQWLTSEAQMVIDYCWFENQMQVRRLTGELTSFKLSCNPALPGDVLFVACQA